MQCTREEIEEKKRLAQLKLKSKQSSDSWPAQHNQQIQHSPNFKKNSNVSYASPSKQFSFKPYERSKPLLSFYGQNKVITGKCYLISDSRFAVNLLGYSTLAVDIFKTIPTKSYNMKTKIWDFHIKDYDLLQNKLKHIPDIVVGKIPAYALHCCQEQQASYDDFDLSRIDSELLNSLMPFQEIGVCFGIDKKGRCLIADDMGLGKTFQALGIASYFRDDWPLLIATTASMKNIWEETIHKYLPSVSVMETQYMISAKDYIKDAKVLIVSHDMMSRALDKLHERNFGIIIIDESHTFKNFKAKCTQAAAALAKKAKRVILLSGTPALSRPSELYSQLSLINDKFFGNFFDYSKRYCDGKTTQFGWDASGQSNLEELEIILNKKFMIRRTKEDVLKMLPDKKQEIVKLDVKLCQLSEDDRKYLNALAQKYSEKKGSSRHSLLLPFFQETSKIKIPSVCSYILQVLDCTNKFLVFAHHQKMLDAVQQVLVSRNKKYIRIDGNTTSEQRKHFVDKFQLDDDYVCGILSITAANAGITLTKAQLIIFAELHWNPSILSQAESRAHRIGQEGQVIVKYLLAPGTADDSIWPLLQEKQKTLNKIGLSKDSFNDVSISNQDLSKNMAIAECLNTGKTGYQTLDITTYFKTNEKTQDPNTSTSSTEDTDLFDDGMDDILSNLEV